MTQAYPYEEGGYTLYSNALCPFAQRALRAFGTAKVPVKVIEIDLSNKPTWYKLVNPQLKVPTLRTPDGTILIESLVISEFVAENFPSAQLIIGNATERAQLRLFIETFSSHVVPYYYKTLRASTVDEQNEAKESLLEGLKEINDELVRQWGRESGKGGPFWNGSKFSYAEIVASSFVSLIVVVLGYYRGFVVPKSEEYAAFNRWADAVFEDPDFKAFRPTDEKAIESYKKYIPELN